jgi:YVTN family beta-propeller protein
MKLAYARTITRRPGRLWRAAANATVALALLTAYQVSPDNRDAERTAVKTARFVYVSDARWCRCGRIEAAVSTADVGPRPWGLALSPGAHKLYVANGPSNDVAVIDAESGRILRKIAVGKSPWGVAVAVAR